jgi:MFS family permease
VPEAFAALRYRDFRLLTAGLAAAISGWWMIVVAQGWLVLELTDSAFWVATASAVLSLPFLVLGPFSGVAADRWNRKVLLVTTRSTVALVMLVEGVLIVGGLIELWQILLLGSLAGCAFAMDIPARQSLIPDVVPHEVIPNAVALNVSVFSFASIAGPIAGAGMLVLVGADGKWNVVGDFVGGLRFVGTSTVVSMLLLMALVTMVGTSAWRELAPVFVRDVYGGSESGLGALHTAAGVGALVGAGLLLWRVAAAHRTALYVVAAAATVLSVIGFVASPLLLFAVAFAFLNGLARQLTDALGQTVLLLQTPDHVRGRVMSLWSLLWGLQPFGTFTAGMLAEVVGPRAAVGGLALVAGAALVTIGLAMRPAWRQL